MKAVFFYGLFMDESLLKGKGLNPSKPVIGYIEGYGLRIGERATLIKSLGERAYGAIMSLSDRELGILYGEPSVADYVPEKVIATTEDRRDVEVLCYNLPLDLLTGQNKDYAEKLAAVARKSGLPAAYIDEIRRWTQ